MNCKKNVLLIRSYRGDDELVRQLDDALVNVFCIPITRIEEIEQDQRDKNIIFDFDHFDICLLYTSPSPRD